MSHPVWVRGLKLSNLPILLYFNWSHPVWVRGLKQTAKPMQHYCMGRTPCGCVD